MTIKADDLLPLPPDAGAKVYVLAAVRGALQWLATERTGDTIEVAEGRELRERAIVEPES